MTWTFICTLSLGLSVRGLAVSVCAPRAQNSARDRAGAHTAFAEWTGPTNTKPYTLVHPPSECHPPLTTGTETSQGGSCFKGDFIRSSEQRAAPGRCGTSVHCSSLGSRTRRRTENTENIDTFPFFPVFSSSFFFGTK